MVNLPNIVIQIAVGMSNRQPCTDIVQTVRRLFSKKYMTIIKNRPPPKKKYSTELQHKHASLNHEDCRYTDRALNSLSDAISPALLLT